MDFPSYVRGTEKDAVLEEIREWAWDSGFDEGYKLAIRRMAEADGVTENMVEDKIENHRCRLLLEQA